MKINKIFLKKEDNMLSSFFKISFKFFKQKKDIE